MRRHRAVGVLTLCAALGGAALRLPAQEPYPWTLPPGFPPPSVPADDPMTPAKVELGRYLFYDTRLSGNGSESCGTCHQQDKAFTDGRAQSVGSTGQRHSRSSMSLVNVAYANVLTWANPTLTRLEDQMLVPMYGAHPDELGLDRGGRWLDALRTDDRYRRLFTDAFGGGAGAFSLGHVVQAIATFERSIVSARSPFDRYHFSREAGAISAAAIRGEALFNSRRVSCVTCHGGPNFSNAMGEARDVDFDNIGLYNLPGLFSYPADNTGLFAVSHRPADVGKFKAPTLRNIAVTAPYMHDGSDATLEAVIDDYAAGGRTIASGPLAGDGRANPNKSPDIHGFTLTMDERADLIAFLDALTDEAVLRDPRFADPFARPASDGRLPPR